MWDFMPPTPVCNVPHLHIDIEHVQEFVVEDEVYADLVEEHFSIITVIYDGKGVQEHAKYFQFYLVKKIVSGEVNLCMPESSPTELVILEMHQCCTGICVEQGKKEGEEKTFCLFYIEDTKKGTKETKGFILPFLQ